MHPDKRQVFRDGFLIRSGGIEQIELTGAHPRLFLVLTNPYLAGQWHHELERIILRANNMLARTIDVQRRRQRFARPCVAEVAAIPPEPERLRCIAFETHWNIEILRQIAPVPE